MNMKKGNNSLIDETIPDIEGGNGNNGNGKGILDGAYLEGMLGDASTQSIAKELVHPGEKPEELLMRCNFKTEAQRNAAIEYLSRCNEFDDEEGKAKILNWLASTVSIDGMARRELTMVATGRVMSELYSKKSVAYDNKVKEKL